MKRSVLNLLIPAILLFTEGCAEKPVETLAPEARDLYKKSADLIRSYTDSITRAEDSVSWAAIDHRFEERLTKLNFKYPADTDLHLSQGENDTLYILTTRYVRAKAEAHTRILRGPLPADTLAQDSTRNHRTIK